MQPLRRHYADETRNQTGYKVGDFGSGGRRYVTHKRIGKDGTFGHLATSYGGLGVWAFAVLALLSGGLVFWAERNLASTLQMLAEVESSAVVLPSPEARPGNDGALVSAVASPRVDDGGLRDDYFGHRFGAALEMRRETECTFTPKKLLA